jgi:hypothetical protein
MPGIPGVVAIDPKVTDGAFTDAGDEHPATMNNKSKTRAPQGRPRITMHLHRRRESKPRQEIGRRVTDRQAGSFRDAGTNTSMAPSCSRTIKVGNGFGAIGS